MRNDQKKTENGLKIKVITDKSSCGEAGAF